MIETVSFFKKYIHFESVSNRRPNEWRIDMDRRRKSENGGSMRKEHTLIGNNATLSDSVLLGLEQFSASERLIT